MRASFSLSLSLSLSLQLVDVLGQLAEQSAEEVRLVDVVEAAAVLASAQTCLLCPLQHAGLAGDLAVVRQVAGVPQLALV